MQQPSNFVASMPARWRMVERSLVGEFDAKGEGGFAVEDAIVTMILDGIPTGVAHRLSAGELIF